MQVYGEAFLLMNGWMNFLSLLLAFRLARRPFFPFRGVAAAAVGAGYALGALAGPVWLRGPLPLAGAAALMGAVSGGAGGLFAAPMIFAGGWLLSGMMNFCLAQGLGPWWSLLVSGCGAMLLAQALGRATATGTGSFQVSVRLGKGQAQFSAIRDSGNLLRDPVTGLPVIVAPLGVVRGLLPQGWDPLNPAMIPRGGRLLPIRTAAGVKLACCLHPEEVMLRKGRRCWRADALIAISDFDEKRALLPGSLFMQEEGKLDAGV